MKKIGILTFHNACNYGAFLQTKALSEFINEQCEREVYIVDYKNKSILMIILYVMCSILIKG